MTSTQPVRHAPSLLSLQPAKKVQIMLPDSRGILRPRMVRVETANKFDNITAAEEMMDAMGVQPMPGSAAIPVTSSLASLGSTASQHGSTASIGSQGSQHSMGSAR